MRRRKLLLMTTEKLEVRNMQLLLEKRPRFREIRMIAIIIGARRIQASIDKATEIRENGLAASMKPKEQVQIDAPPATQDETNA